ncbi:hypothetical protein [Pseudomonas asiatica]|uniref:hypothetical protein n=1 Tax=Pseudomonas asiatica TaxID=2219225 RepID=UPI00383AFAED
MVRDTRTDTPGALLDVYDRKMARHRPEFLNQETLDTIAREHQVYLKRLGEAPQRATSSRPDDFHET